MPCIVCSTSASVESASAAWAPATPAIFSAASIADQDQQAWVRRTERFRQRYGLWYLPTTGKAGTATSRKLAK